MNRSRQVWIDRLILVLLGSVSWFSFLSRVHLIDWDEANFAEISREMLVLNDFSRTYINFELFWEKPPLFFWLQAASMKLFGVNEFAARFPNAVAGILTLLLLHHLGRKLVDLQMGRIWSGLWFGSLLTHLYAKSGIIDPWFNLLMFLGLWGIIRYLWAAEARKGWELRFPLLAAVAGGFALGLAVLAKGPVGLLLPGLALTLYALWHRLRYWRLVAGPIIWTLVAIATCGLWFIPEIIANGIWFSQEFINYQIRLFQTEDAGHGGFPGYHFVVLLVGMFPASFLAIGHWFKKHDGDAQGDDLDLWMTILLVVVLLVFSLAQSKIVHYSSLAYFPLTWLAARRVHRLFSSTDRLTLFERSGLITMGLLFAAGSIGIGVLGNSQAKNLPASDPFLQARLQDAVSWPWHTMLPGPLLLGALTLAWFWWKSRRSHRAFFTMILGSALFVQSGLWSWSGRIEHYLQGPAIDYYESLRDQDVYVTTIGIRSYTPFFYSRKAIPEGWSAEAAERKAKEQQNSQGRNSFVSSQSSDPNWLVFSPDLDKTAWIVSKEKSRAFLSNIKDVELVKEDHGYLLWKREPPSKP